MAKATKVVPLAAEQGNISLTIRASSQSVLRATFSGLVALASKSAQVADAYMDYAKTPAPGVTTTNLTSPKRASRKYVAPKSERAKSKSR